MDAAPDVGERGGDIWSGDKEERNTGQREIGLLDVIVHVDKLGVLRSKEKGKTYHQALSKHLVVEDSSGQVFCQICIGKIKKKLPPLKRNATLSYRTVSPL